MLRDAPTDLSCPLQAADHFAARLRAIDRSLRRAGATIPPQETRDEVAQEFWSLVRVLDASARNGGDLTRQAGEVRRIVGPWLFRSRYFNRSYHKPHGYAGDFRMVEWMYDLETDPCADATQPGIVNCLDHVFSTVHSVRGVWQRRRRFAHLLAEEHAANGGRLRLLDVASGGSRYVRDFLEGVRGAAGIELTLVDQDPAALAFCRTVSLAPWADRLTTLSVPVTSLPEHLAAGSFDVVLSAGLFDYLADDPARRLLRHLVSLAAPGGVIAVANFHPSDPSRVVKDWLVDWPLVFRTEAALAALYPDPDRVRTEQTDETLVSAFARRPAAGDREPLADHPRRSS